MCAGKKTGPSPPPAHGNMQTAVLCFNTLEQLCDGRKVPCRLSITEVLPWYKHSSVAKHHFDIKDLSANSQFLSLGVLGGMTTDGELSRIPCHLKVSDQTHSCSLKPGFTETKSRLRMGLRNRTYPVRDLEACQAGFVGSDTGFESPPPRNVPLSMNCWGLPSGGCS